MGTSEVARLAQLGNLPRLSPGICPLESAGSVICLPSPSSALRPLFCTASRLFSAVPLLLNPHLPDCACGLLFPPPRGNHVRVGEASAGVATHARAGPDRGSPVYGVGRCASVSVEHLRPSAHTESQSIGGDAQKRRTLRGKRSSRSGSFGSLNTPGVAARMSRSSGGCRQQSPARSPGGLLHQHDAIEMAADDPCATCEQNRSGGRDDDAGQAAAASSAVALQWTAHQPRSEGLARRVAPRPEVGGVRVPADQHRLALIRVRRPTVAVVVAVAELRSPGHSKSGYTGPSKSTWLAC